MLKLLGPNAVGATGDTATITLVSRDAQIAAASYVNSTTIAQDGQSLTLQIAAGPNNLLVSLASPYMGNEHFRLMSGITPLRFGTLIGGAASVVISIVGQ